MRGKIVNSARRTGMAAIFALLLAVRLLTPAGFMPQFDRGQVTIVVCEDVAPSSHHDHDTGKSKHSQPCPYGAASALSLLDQPVPAVAAPYVGAPVVLSYVLHDLSTQERHPPRPPSRAPPAAI